MPGLLGLSTHSDVLQLHCWRLVVASFSFWVSDVRQPPLWGPGVVKASFCGLVFALLHLLFSAEYEYWSLQLLVE